MFTGQPHLFQGVATKWNTFSPNGRQGVDTTACHALNCRTTSPHQRAPLIPLVPSSLACAKANVCAPAALEMMTTG